MAKKIGAGVRKLPEYGVWNSMRQRCGNLKNTSFKYYGGRGIYVCDTWQASFIAFYEDMGPRPTPQHSIERADRHGPYSPKNCKWATPIEQANNTGKNTLITIAGETKTIAQWSRKTGVERHVISRRVNALGWDHARAVTEDVGKQVQIGDRSQTIAQWCREMGVSSDAVYQRINKLGWTAAKAITAGERHQNRILEHDGITASVSEWSRKIGVSRGAILARLKYGWTIERALSEPVQVRRSAPL